MTVCVFLELSSIVAVSQAQIFREDFEQERRDREKVHAQVAEMEENYQQQLQSVVIQLNHTVPDLWKL